MDFTEMQMEYVEEVKQCSQKDRIKAMDNMVRSAWVLLPCTNVECKKCKYKNACDQTMALLKTISSLVEESESC